MPPKGCADAAAEVRQKQAPATSQQAPTNQNEYLVMGERARALGVVPDMLRPSCADMDGVKGRGRRRHRGVARDDRAPLRARRRASSSIATRGPTPTRAKAVVVYGGMLHNDLDPPPERAKWSYAPALDAKTGGKLVAVDLVVPEFIVDDATWRAFAVGLALRPRAPRGEDDALQAGREELRPRVPRDAAVGIALSRGASSSVEGAIAEPPRAVRVTPRVSR